MYAPKIYATGTCGLHKTIMDYIQYTLGCCSRPIKLKILSCNFYLSSSWRFRTKTLLVKFRKNLSMFKRVAQWHQNFGNFKKKKVFSFWMFLDYKSNLWSLLILSTVFGSRSLVHSQQENFSNQSHQKLHYWPTATSIINTKLLHIFVNWLINFTSGSDFNLKRAHYCYLPNVSFFLYSRQLC